MTPTSDTHPTPPARTLSERDVTRLVDAGRLKSITGHGELDLPGGCFLRITPGPRINTYGLGMSIRQLLKDPLGGAGVVELAR